MDLTENRTATFILSYLQKLFKDREYLETEELHHEDGFVDELMELSQPTSAFAYFGLTAETVRHHEIFLETLSGHKSLTMLIKPDPPVRYLRFLGPF